MFTIPCKYASLKRKKKYCGRAALCTLKKASLTVEAAIVLPVFLLAMVMFSSVIDICTIKIEAQAKLTQKAKELSMYAYALPELAKDGYIDLYQIETYDLPVKLFPFAPVKIAVRARVHAWMGRTETKLDTSDITMGQREETVYVTDRETVYHTHEECTHLTLTIIQTDARSLKSLRNEEGKVYTPCEKCCDVHQKAVGDTYYVAEYGESYHSSLQCGSLKRTTRIIPKSEIENLSQCQRCQALDTVQLSKRNV